MGHPQTTPASSLRPGVTTGVCILLSTWLLSPGRESTGEAHGLLALPLVALAGLYFLRACISLAQGHRPESKNAAVACAFALAGIPFLMWLIDHHRTAQFVRGDELIRLIDAHVARHKAFPKTLAEVGPAATAIGSTGEEEPTKAFIYTIGRDGTYWAVYFGRPSFSATLYRSDRREWQTIDLH